MGEGPAKVAASVGEMHITKKLARRSSPEARTCKRFSNGIRAQLCPKPVKAMTWKALGPPRQTGRAPSADQPGIVIRARFWRFSDKGGRVSKVFLDAASLGSQHRSPRPARTRRPSNLLTFH